MTDKLSFQLNNLSIDEVEDLLFQAEQAARRYITSQVPPKELKTFDILIEFDPDQVSLECIIDLQLTKKSMLNPQIITEAAVQLVFETIEKILGKKEL